MAEGGNAVNTQSTLPQRGKVKKVAKEFAVHEDGAFAYQLQNQEINRHYGINRFNRRTVRDDIPIAKVVQTDEEIQQQNERFTELQVLRAQAEEDERVAKQLLEQDQLQNEAHKVALELTDEEFAKSVQEKEKKKYERYLEKKKSQKLKQERQAIERTQQQRTEEAGLNVRNTGSTEELDTRMADMNVDNGSAAMRVTPGGQIEDGGDFSDFYDLPEHIDPAHRQALQELQDEELAKLLQEQEHKRSKAEVDKNKLKEIEEQDKRLAQIIQEQEKIKVKKAKQKRKQQDDARRAQEAAQRPPALPPRPNEHDHRRYRRNSFIQSMENGPTEGETAESGTSPHAPGNSDGYMTPMQAAAEQRLHSSVDHRFSSGGRQTSSDKPMNNSRQPQQSREIKQNKQTVQQVKNNLHTSGRGRGPELDQAYLPQQEMPDVERWLASQPPEATRGRLRSDNSEHLPDSPSPPGSYHSEDAFPHGGYPRGSHHNTSTDNGSHYAVSDPFNFNIAAAIDPTYTRRSMDGNTDRKQPATVQTTRAVPQEVCTELEWDPSVRGSIRRGSLSRLQGSSAAFYNNGYQDRTMSTVSSRGSFPEDGSGVVNPFAPVQGQKRGGEKSRKSSKKQEPADPKQKDKCKQQ